MAVVRKVLDHRAEYFLQKKTSLNSASGNKNAPLDNPRTFLDDERTKLQRRWRERSPGYI